MQQKKTFEFTKKRADNLFVFGMLLLPFINFIVFYLYVNFDSFLMAFQVPIGDEIRWGLENFETMFKEFSFSGGVLSLALKNTFIYFFSGLLITLPLSFFLCYFLYKKVFGYKVFRVIFYLPSIISASVLVVLFKYFISVEGPLDRWMVDLGFGQLPELIKNAKTSTTVINFYNIFFGLGGNLVLFSGAMSNIDSSVTEAAKIDGAGMITEMFRIVIPLMWPTLSTVLIFQFIGVFNASGPILLFTTGQYETTTISYWIYDKVKFGATLHYPSAVGMFFTFIGAPIALVMRWLLTKFYDYES